MQKFFSGGARGFWGGSGAVLKRIYAPVTNLLHIFGMMDELEYTLAEIIIRENTPCSNKPLRI